MASAVGKFFGEFGLDIDPFLKSVREVEREAKSIENSIKPLKNIAEDFGKSFAVAGAAITGALGVMVMQAANYGDAIRDASIRTGIGTAAMGGLKIAAEQSGATFEDLQNGLKKLAVNSDAAAKGTKEQAELFKTIGVNVRGASGEMRPMNDILGDVADHFKKSTNATKEAGEAVALFGKNGTQLIEFLELGKSGLQEFQEKAERLGLAIGDDVANQADKFKDTMNDLKAAETGASLVIGNALLPALTDLVVMFTNGVVKVREFAKEHENLTKVLAAVGLSLTGAGGLLLGLAGLLTILPKVREAWILLDAAMTANPIGVAVVGIGALTAGLVYFRSEIVGATINTLSLLVGGFGFLVEAAGKAAGALGMQSFGKSLSMTGASIKEMAGDMIALGSNLMDTGTAVDGITPLIDKFREAHKKATGGIIDNETAMAEAAKIAHKYREALNEVYQSQVERAAKFVQAWLDGFQKTSEAADKYTESLERLQVKTRELSFTSLDAMVAAQSVWDNISTGKAFEAQVDLFNKLHELRKTDLDDKVEFDEAWDKALKRSNEKQAADYKKAIDDIRHSAGAVFDDMFLKGQGVFKSLQNMLKGGALSLGRTIFEDITGALLGPVLNAFRNFFNTTIKGVIDGALGGIGKTIGGALGGIIGIGGAAVPHLPGGAAGPVLGSTGSLGLFGLSGAATLGIGAAIAGGVALATHFIGQGRRAENAFTSGSQNQFGADLGNVFNQFQSQRANGSLTLDSATALQKQMTDLLHGITDDADAFAAKGKTEKKVVDQFFAQQQQLFGKDWVNLTSQIDASIASLKATAAASPAATAATGALAGVPDTGRGISASTIIAGAADVFKAAVDKFSGNGAAQPSQPISLSLTVTQEINVDGASDGSGFDIDAFKRALSLNTASLTEMIAQKVKSYLPGVVAAGGAA